MTAPLGNQNAKGHGKGRPSEYDKSLVDEVFKYIDRCVKKSKSIDTFELPSVEGLAVHLHKSKATLYKWADLNVDFMYALEFLSSTQCIELINGGLTGKLNSTITKLMLSSNHGMVERKEVKQDTTNRVPVDEDPGVKELKQKLAKEYEAKRKALLKRKK